MTGEKLRILFLSSEMAPYAKEGGLADVTAALAALLNKRGHDIRVFMPGYARSFHNIATESECMLYVSMGEGGDVCSIRKLTAANGVPLYLVGHDGYFGRDGLYHDRAMNDYADNPRRFAFFCRAALQHCIDGDFSPDIVHVNDWQTAPATAYLKIWFWNSPALGKAASVLTIHNAAYRGQYPFHHYGYLGLGRQNWRQEIFEDHGQINFLKGGIYFADAVNTVSPGYAGEITMPYGGFGLAPFLLGKGRMLRGILNGVDYASWSPENDGLLPARYGLHDLSGKAVCKRELQKAFQLAEDPRACLIGAVGRLVDQKGYQLIAETIEEVLRNMHAQFVLLGSGEKHLEDYFAALPRRFPGRAGSYIGYNNELAHLIEAGADFFLMPSLFEPCGLNQMYSLRYGTLPIARATGGLKDTVEQYDETTGTGTGFLFRDATPPALYYTIGWAVSTFFDRPQHMGKMIAAAMKKDFSWENSVREYEDLYRLAAEAKKMYDLAHRL